MLTPHLLDKEMMLCYFHSSVFLFYFLLTRHIGRYLGVFMSDDSTPKYLEDINWEELHVNSRQQKGWESKKATDWDKKAPSFSSASKNSEYAEIFIKHLPLDKNTSVLDIGAGPGTLTIPISKFVHSVTAIDYSQGMLEYLNNSATNDKINNIKTVRCAWEDNWLDFGVTPHDIVIASRSMNVANLKNALVKANNFAKKFVFVADRINPTPFDGDAFKAIGRPFQAGPDYIFTVNMLYSMNIHPNITLLEFDKTKKFIDREAAYSSFFWMFNDLTANEQEKLKTYVDSLITKDTPGEILVEPRLPVRWALIWWAKPENLAED